MDAGTGTTSTRRSAARPAAVRVSVVVPGAMPCSVPALSMVATAASLAVQVSPVGATRLPRASLARARSATDVPSAIRITLSPSMASAVTRGRTQIRARPARPPMATVTSVTPGARATTCPVLSTCAIAGSSTDQWTAMARSAWPCASAAVVVMCRVSPRE